MEIERVLVIDDDPVMRQLIGRTLESAGYGVTAVSDGRAGLAVLESQIVHLVITDIYMPGQDGIVTIRRVRRDWPSLPVIVMSGGSAAGDLIDAALALGASLALRKPFESRDLLDGVKIALSRQP